MIGDKVTKNSFVLGYTKLSDNTLDILLLKVGEIFTFKEVDLKNLIASFMDVDAFVYSGKLPTRTQKFLENINIKYFNLANYDDINDMIHDINKYLLKKKKPYRWLKEALKILNESYQKGNLNYHELLHSIRVANNAKEFANYIGYIDPDHVFVAGLLHDIGKTGIPHKILVKPGKLNAWEISVIKAHPSIGSYLVPETFADIIKQHHERYDGSGYPKGLKKNQINYEAQILSIVDSYDTITTKRSYKEKLTKKEALNEILMCITDSKDGGKGLKYNPKLTIKFIKLKMNKE